MFKNKKNIILYFFTLITVGLFWWFTFTKTYTYKLSHHNNYGTIDTTYHVSFYNKKIINGDTLFLYYDDNKKLTLIIKKDSLKYYKFNK